MDLLHHMNRLASRHPRLAARLLGKLTLENGTATRMQHAPDTRTRLLLDLCSNHALDETDLPVALQVIVAVSIETLDCRTTVWLFNADDNCYHCAAGSDAQDTLLAPIGAESVLHSLFRRSETQFIPSALFEPSVVGASSGQAEQLLMCMPLLVHRTPAGVVLFEKSPQGSWNPADSLSAQVIAKRIQQKLDYDQHEKLQSDFDRHVAKRTAELRQQTEELSRAHQTIHQLSEIGREITSSLDQEVICDIAYRHMHELTGAELFGVGLYVPERETIDFPYNILSGQKFPPYSLDATDHDLLSVCCLQSQKPIFIRHLQTEYRHYISDAGLAKYAEVRRRCGYPASSYPQSLIYVPMMLKHKLKGVVVVQSMEAYAFLPLHVDMVVTLTAYMAIAIENAETYRKLSKAQEILLSQEKLAALGSLVAGVAHELNTPIGNSLLTASTLQEQTRHFLRKLAEPALKRSDLQQFAMSMQDGSELLMRNLISASELVTSFKQVSADQASQQRRRFNLRRTTEEIARTLRSQIQKQGHSFHADIPPHIELNSYPGPYGQIITNLINNAMLHAFSGQPGGKMYLQAEQISLDKVRLIFSDNGYGIDAQDLRRIFDPFFTTKLGQGGSGLGLSIVHNLVTTVMEGSIDVDSTRGQGTRFFITLAIAPANKPLSS